MKLLIGDCVTRLKELADESIDMALTSPPYDDMDFDFNPISKNGMRKYNGYSWDFKGLAHEIYRVLKQGGVLVWVVNDPTIKGSESLASCLQKIYFRKMGFNVHDTMIWNKGNFTAVGSLKTRYAPVFEYMFILSKGAITKFNAIKDRKNKYPGTFQHGTISQKDGSKKQISSHNKRKFKEYGCRHNIWEIVPCKERINHPARFPLKLAEDHILSWSNPGDTVLDPMMGSGTVGKMALKNGRDFIGIELSKEYFEIAKQRIEGLQISATQLLCV